MALKRSCADRTSECCDCCCFNVKGKRAGELLTLCEPFSQVHLEVYTTLCSTVQNWVQNCTQYCRVLHRSCAVCLVLCRLGAFLLAWAVPVNKAWPASILAPFLNSDAIQGCVCAYVCIPLQSTRQQHGADAFLHARRHSAENGKRKQPSQPRCSRASVSPRIARDVTLVPKVQLDQHKRSCCGTQWPR